MRLDANLGVPPVTFRQLGYLSSALEGSQRLPLYGQESRTRRDRWHYYAVSPEGIKVAIRDMRSSPPRDCLDEVGCSELFDGDEVSLEDLGGRWTAKLYQKHFYLNADRGM